MKRSRFGETHIISILKEAEAGMAVKDVCRKNGISSPTYYKWKAQYGGLDASKLKRRTGHVLLRRAGPTRRAYAA